MNDQPTRALVLAVLGALLVMVSGCGDANDGASNGASSLELRDIDADGIRTLVEEPDAPLLLVNVWATWCAPCVAEFPDLVRLGREFAGRGLRVVFISADFEENVSAALEFLREQGVGSVSYRKTGPDEAFIDALSDEWSGALPGTFLFRDGERIHSWEGKQSYEEFEGRILDALEIR